MAGATFFTVTLRPATLDDVELLDHWDTEPHVISATTDEERRDTALPESGWTRKLGEQSDVNRYVIAELEGRPLGAMQIIDPHTEPAHCWGVVEPGLRAIAIWIYERLGFQAVERRFFAGHDCLVHWFTRRDWRLRFPQD